MQESSIVRGPSGGLFQARGHPGLPAGKGRVETSTERLPGLGPENVPDVAPVDGRIAEPVPRHAGLWESDLEIAVDVGRMGGCCVPRRSAV
jgi:hypothetical protein